MTEKHIKSVSKTENKQMLAKNIYFVNDEFLTHIE